MFILVVVTVLFDDLGMPISEAFAQIQQQPSIYDVVHVKYYEEVNYFNFMFFPCPNLL